MPYLRVIAGTDGSSGARRAERVAERLARSLDVELMFVSAYEDESAAEKVLSAARDGASSYAKVTTHKEKGDPADVIVDLAEKSPAPVIVVGNKGMTSSARFLLGSVPDRITHHSPCDVLIISGSAGDEPEPLYRKIVVGTDGSETSIEAAGRGLALAGKIGATPVMFYAGHPKTAEIVFEEVWNTLKPNREFETAVMSGDPADKICELAEKEGYDLIVIGNRGMAGGRFQLGSVPNKISHHSPCDVLIVKTVSRTIEELREGEGAMVALNGVKVAAFKEPGGALHMLNPKCQHMGCTVGWNPVEQTWDCPCHGSRYSFDGEVLRGPTTKALLKHEA